MNAKPVIKSISIALAALLANSAYANAKMSQLTDNVISAGSGYSTDSQQVTPEICYNATEGALAGTEEHISLQDSVSFSNLESALNYSISTSGDIGMFSASAEANYLRDIEDKDYSLSLNYYSYADATAPIQLQGSGIQALNSAGQSFYQGGKNPYFGLICGDEYVSSYKKGALLTMALNIQFQSHYEKEQFEAAAGASFNDIFSASSKIRQLVQQYDIKGNISLEAYQMGGDPGQLSKILNKSTKGNFYILSCSLQDMQNCLDAANGLLDYASNNFPNQFSFKNNTGLTPLNIGFANLEPIRYIGLTPPPSLVTPQVLQDRNNLTQELTETNYYQAKLLPIMNTYAVPWDEGSALYKGILQLSTQVNNNASVIQGSASNPDQGALGCYDQPDTCDKTYQSIQSHYKPVVAGSLEFLAPMQYTYEDGFATYYFNGTGYGHVNNPNNEDQVNYMYPDYDFTNNLKNIHYSVHSTSSGPGGDGKQWDWYFDQGILSADGKTIAMRMRCSSWGPGYYDYPTINRDTSAFYFNLYQPSKKP